MVKMTWGTSTIPDYVRAGSRSSSFLVDTPPFLPSQLILVLTYQTSHSVQSSMPPSKRSRSCSSLQSSQKRIATASCTRDTPSENELTNLRNSCVELLETVGQSLVEPADIPTPSIMSPPSPLASLSRPNSPTKLSDANYRYRVIQRAKIFVDSDIPEDVKHYVNTNVFHPWLNTEDVTIVAKDLWASSKALVLVPYVETDWLVPLRSAIDRLIPEGLIVASNRGKLLTDIVIVNPC